MSGQRRGLAAVLAALALAGAAWFIVTSEHAGAGGIGTKSEMKLPADRVVLKSGNDPARSVVMDPPGDPMGPMIRIECRSLGGRFESVPTGVEVVVGAGDSGAIKVERLQVADGVLLMGVPCVGWTPGALIEARIPGFVPSRTVLPVEPDTVPLTLMSAGSLEVELLGATDALFEHLDVSVWLEVPSGVAGTKMVHADGSYLEFPGPVMPMTRSRCHIGGLPSGVKLALSVTDVSGVDFADRVEVRVPQIVQLQLRESGLIAIQCSQEVDGVVICRNALGRCATARVVRGRSTVRWIDENRDDLQCEAWGEGWVAVATPVPTRVVAPVLLDVRERPTLRIDLDSDSEIIGYIALDRGLSVMDSTGSVGQPVCWQRGKQLLVAGSSPGQTIILRSPAERSLRALVVPDERVAKVDLSSLRRGSLSEGIVQYERLRAMYRGTRGATCDIGIVVPVGSSREALVLLETLYFFDRGLGDFSRPESWWFRDPAPGRYALSVRADGKELDRVELAWTVEAGGR